ncbi:MAG: hypothetical protein A2086_12110 [Spirochaetes bacterium GWD1_27_9]|nr:MAG: hypothetical protein A2Z98_03060 [Spirochaetes bacterium GWB1_27_13]OHD22933.1 MAG: hypothetical protein A2Y34_09170 [Spirochaetes bacterium GWC1_27_15]OHD28974.1 MAG: hypothetical protein A2086_12110 [Spirochaetes bacterium GWD1_27_9]
MKSKIIIILSFICLSLYPQANRDLEKFNNAINLYSKKNYEESLKIFLELRKSGIDNFEINYNIGCTYTKLKKLGLARFYFENALVFKPFDSDLFHNLKVVYNDILKDPLIGEQEIMNKRIIYFFPLSLLVILFLICFLLSVLWIFLFFKLNNKKFFLIFFIIFIFFSFIFTLLFLLQYSEYNKKVFVVVENTANVYIAPSSDETILVTLSEGTKGNVVNYVGDYIKINLADGSSGWIKKDMVIYRE